MSNKHLLTKRQWLLIKQKLEAELDFFLESALGLLVSWISIKIFSNNKQSNIPGLHYCQKQHKLTVTENCWPQVKLSFSSQIKEKIKVSFVRRRSESERREGLNRVSDEIVFNNLKYPEKNLFFVGPPYTNSNLIFFKPSSSFYKNYSIWLSTCYGFLLGM